MSTRTLAAAVMVMAVGAACGAKPPEPLERPRQKRRPVSRDTQESVSRESPERETTPSPPTGSKRRGKHRADITFERPALASKLPVADPSYVLRWPLGTSSHPELRPQFDIAGQLAEPGVDWIDLCRMGAHNRLAGNKLRDQLTYLRGWCKVAQRDHDGALAELVKVRTSTVRGLAPMVRADIVNIVLDAGSNGHPAADLLAKHRLMEPDLLDLLAATYYDLGAVPAAVDMNERAIGNDNFGNVTSSCRRFAKRVVSDPEPYRKRLIVETAGIDVKDVDAASVFPFGTSGDPTCKLLDHELACWLRPDVGCDAYFKDTSMDPKLRRLYAATAAWPQVPSNDSGGWLLVADAAIEALPLDDAFELAVTALEYSMVVRKCAKLGAGVKQRLDQIAAAKPPQRFADRIDTLRNTPHELCSWD